MPDDAAWLDALVALLDAAEQEYPYVTVERLRRLARRDPATTPLAPRLAGLVRAALAEGLLLADNRLRVTRSGELRPVRIYRLNRRSERVMRLL